MHAPCTRHAHTTRAPLALQVLLHEWLLASPHRTLDPTEADWFYVPVYATCAIATPHAYMPRTRRAHAVHAPCTRRAHAVHTHTPCTHTHRARTSRGTSRGTRCAIVTHIFETPHTPRVTYRVARAARLYQQALAFVRSTQHCRMPRAVRPGRATGASPWPPGAGSPGSGLRHTLGVSSRAAAGPIRGCGPNQGLRAQSGAAVLL